MEGNMNKYTTSIVAMILALVCFCEPAHAHRFDAETGLFYCKNRYYASGLGRFLSRDPLEYRGPHGDKLLAAFHTTEEYDQALQAIRDINAYEYRVPALSLYEYTNSRPTKWLDPVGLDPMCSTIRIGCLGGSSMGNMASDDDEPWRKNPVHACV